MSFATRKAIVEDNVEGSRELAEGIARGAWVAEDGDGPLAFWGLIPESILGEAAFIWFHPVKDISQYRVQCLRANRRYLAATLQIYPRLYSTVIQSNEVARRWAKWLGFHVVVGEEEIQGQMCDIIQMEIRNGH